MNKSVLIVTPFFAPQSHAAMFRAYKLAKYLPRFGWKPYVLTVDTNYHYNEDPGLLDELPPEVEIIKARYVEPTLRGVRMALGGKDRTFPAMKHDLVASADGPSWAPSALKATGQRAYRHVLETRFQAPDPYWTWYRPALREARRLVAEHDIQVVYTSSTPFTCNQIGLALKKSGARWIADFRDAPPTYLRRTSASASRVYAKQRQIERSTVKVADVITVTSTACAMLFQDMYGSDIHAPIEVIPTGVDNDYLDETTETTTLQESIGAPYLVFSGEYLPEYSAQFLESFAIASARESVRQTGTRLIVIGSRSLNQERMAPILDRLQIEHLVEFRDHMPQRALYPILRGAKAAVLIPGSRAFWWTTFAKMVDYIALRIPTLAIVPDPSEARRALSRTGLGIFLDEDTALASQTLAEFLTGHISLPTPNPAECDRYLATNQVGSFVAVFDGVL